jgi:ubiquinone/menaquinone biosynthesis C-methylase UbiE
MNTSDRSYIPAAGHNAALPLYDPLTTLAGARPRRRVLIDRADLRAGQRVLDVGCGTGELALAIKRAHPDVEVTAIDPDPLALARARAKAGRAGVRIQLDRGFGDALPYADATFTRVFSSFMLHHLDPPAQRRLLTEALRVLAAGGSIHLIDFAAGAQPKVLGRRAAEQIDLDLRESGFSAVHVEPQRRWLFQRVVYCSGIRAPAVR